MAHQQLWGLGQAIAKSHRTPGLHDRLIEEARGWIMEKRENPVHTLVNTIVPVRAATIALFSFHLLRSPDDVPTVIRSAASAEGHRHQELYAEKSLFSELFTDDDVVWVPDGYYVSTFTVPARFPEEVLADLTEVPEGGAYFIENDDGSVACSVVRTAECRYYHMYPNDSGLLLVGPASLRAACDSLMSNYPRTLTATRRYVVQKNGLRPHIRSPD